MTPLTWNHACSVGIRALDDQHGILMDTINELRMALVCGRERHRLAELLDRLIDFTRMHFASEERLMEESGFPALAEHRAEHQAMLQQLLASTHRLQHEEDLPTHTLLRTLRQAFLHHIESFDRAYGPWLNQRGIS